MSEYKKGDCKPKFAVGDKVSEKKRSGMYIASANAFRTQSACTDHTVGEVLSIIEKTNNRGHKLFYYEVKWLKANRIAVHSSMRLKSAEDE